MIAKIMNPMNPTRSIPNPAMRATFENSSHVGVAASFNPFKFLLFHQSPSTVLLLYLGGIKLITYNRLPDCELGEYLKTGVI